MIVGENIYLRPMEMGDVQNKVNWINDPNVSDSGFLDYPVSVLSTENWLKKASMDSTRKDFIICFKSNDNPIGYAGLKNIDFRNSKAESYLGIGAKEYWGKGIGYDVKKALLLYSFNHLMLNKVYSYHLADNLPMIKINVKLGGKQDGLLRDEVIINGTLKDMVLISVLKNDLTISNQNNLYLSAKLPEYETH